jgi:hypothetical protein
LLDALRALLKEARVVAAFAEAPFVEMEAEVESLGEEVEQ